MKLMLAEQEHQHPNLFANLLTAMRPLMGESVQRGAARA